MSSLSTILIMKYKQPPIGYTDIGRSTIYGNPVKIGKVCQFCPQKHLTAGSTLPCFEKYAKELMSKDPVYKREIEKLKGCALWCPGCGIGSSTCHGRVLEKLCE